MLPSVSIILIKALIVNLRNNPLASCFFYKS